MSDLLIRKKKKGLRRTVDNKIVVKYRKELSPLGRGCFLMFCALAVFFTSKKYFTDKVSHEWQRKIVLVENDYNRKISQLRRDQLFIPYGTRTLRQEVDQVKNKLKELSERESDSQKVIYKQKAEIEKLNRQLRLFINKEIDASTKNRSKVLLYNSANRKSLNFRHVQKLTSLRNKHKEKRELFVEMFDMNDSMVVNRFKEYIDHQEVEYNDLKSKLRERRFQFQKQKFIKLVDNN